MAVAVSAVSLLTAAFGASKLLLPQLDVWAEGRNCGWVPSSCWPSFPVSARNAAGAQTGREKADSSVTAVTPN